MWWWALFGVFLFALGWAYYVTRLRGMIETKDEAAGRELVAHARRRRPF